MSLAKRIASSRSEKSSTQMRGLPRVRLTVVVCLDQLRRAGREDDAEVTSVPMVINEEACGWMHRGPQRGTHLPGHLQKRAGLEPRGGFEQLGHEPVDRSPSKAAVLEEPSRYASQGIDGTLT